MARKRPSFDWDDLPTIRRPDDIAPIVRSHAAIAANAELLVAYAHTNPNDAAHRLCYPHPKEEPMNGGSDGGGAPTPMAEETAI